MALGLVKILAGDFYNVQVAKKAVGPIFRKRLVPRLVVRTSAWRTAKLGFEDIANVTALSQENAGSILGAAGWGLLGDALLGPVGLLAGVVAGAQSTKVTFVCTFKDGRKFLGQTDSDTYNKMFAATWGQ